jgi:hypothetical protein
MEPLAPYRVRLVLDFEARGEDPYGLVLLEGYLKTLLSLKHGAHLSFDTINQGFPGARFRAAAVELTRPDGDRERRELEAE